MSDLERTYADLARQADGVRLPDPGDLRGRADRRARIRLAAGVLAVALVAGIGTAGVGWALRSASSGPDQIPGDVPTRSVTTPTPATATPPTTDPTPGREPTPATDRPPSTPPGTPTGGAVGPASIPDSAFLQRSDSNGDAEPKPSGPGSMLPDLCGAQFPSDRSIVARKHIYLNYWRQPNTEGYVASGTFDETVTSYRGDGAEQFMDQLRAAVASCPTHPEKHGHGTVTTRIRPGPGHGDESVVVEQKQPSWDDIARKFTGDEETFLTSVVRFGPVVMILREVGYEGTWSDPAVHATFTGKAVNRLEAWLGSR